MSAIIPAKDVGRVILEDLRELGRKEWPEKSEAEREEMLASFLGVLSKGMFDGPEEQLHKNHS